LLADIVKHLLDVVLVVVSALLVVVLFFEARAFLEVMEWAPSRWVDAASKGQLGN
jgi:hypothetical protein